MIFSSIRASSGGCRTEHPHDQGCNVVRHVRNLRNIPMIGGRPSRSSILSLDERNIPMIRGKMTAGTSS